MSAAKVASIGLGNIGGGITSSIIKAGFDTTVFDVRPEAVQRFRELGARGASTPAEAARDASILCITVLDDVQLEAVLTGDNGALPALARGATIVVHSTVQPETCRKLAATADAVGVRLVDAPISGGPRVANAGALTLMVGGSKEAVRSCADLFAAISDHYFHVGDVGSGQVAKIANNIMSIINRIVISEGLVLARHADLREDVMLELIKVSSGNSWQLEHWRDMQTVAMTATTGAEGMAAQCKKDLGIAVKIAESYGLDVPLTKLSLENTANMFTEFG